MARSKRRYDKAKNLIEYLDRYGFVERWTYNERNQILHHERVADWRHAGWVEEFTYDDRGNKLSHTTPGGTDTWTYNDDNNVLVENKWRSGITTTIYDSNGRKKSQEHPGGMIEHWLYNERGDILAQHEGTTLVRKNTYDDEGKILTRTTTDSYFTWTYDDAGNMLTHTIDGAVESWTYNDEMNIADTHTTFDGIIENLSETGVIESKQFPDGSQYVLTYDENSARVTAEYISGSRWESINAHYGITPIQSPSNDGDFDLSIAHKIARGWRQREILEQFLSPDGAPRAFYRSEMASASRRFHSLKNNLMAAGYIFETLRYEGKAAEYEHIIGFDPYMGELIKWKDALNKKFTAYQYPEKSTEVARLLIASPFAKASVEAAPALTPFPKFVKHLLTMERVQVLEPLSEKTAPPAISTDKLPTPVTVFELDEYGQVSAKRGGVVIDVPTCTGVYEGQTNASISARCGDQQVGSLNYSVFENEVHIQHVSTEPDYRGAGLATAMFRVLIQNEGGSSIYPGMLTDDGKKWWESGAMVEARSEVTDPLSVAQNIKQQDSGLEDSNEVAISIRLNAHAEAHADWLEELDPLVTNPADMLMVLDARGAAGGEMELLPWLEYEITHSKQLINDLASGNTSDFSWCCVERELLDTQWRNIVAKPSDTVEEREGGRVQGLRNSLECIAGRRGSDEEREALFERLVSTHKVDEHLLKIQVNIQQQLAEKVAVEQPSYSWDMIELVH